MFYVKEAIFNYVYSSLIYKMLALRNAKYADIM